MTNAPHFIPFVSDTALLKRSVDRAVQEIGGRTTLIDNSPDQQLWLNAPIWAPAKVIKPSVPLFTAQTMNWMRQMTLAGMYPYCGFQHADAEPHPGTVRALYAHADQLMAEGAKWGVLFSNYDVCCVLNANAMLAVGEWDWISFPTYHLDNDYYHRMRLAGFPLIQTGLGCDHLVQGSNTLRADLHRQRAHAEYFPASERLLHARWGMAATV